MKTGKEQSRSAWQKIVDDAGFKGAEIIELEDQKVANMFGGGTVMLNPAEAVIYDTLKGAELLQDYKTVAKGIEWFIQNNVEAYSILLD